MTLTTRQNVVVARSESAVNGKRRSDEIRSIVTTSVGDTCGATISVPLVDS
jgi:hypothetical protein